jgi:hypothetical protein
MSSSVPNSSLALDTSATSALPHLYAHSTLSVHRDIRAEDIELSEVNAGLPSPEQKTSVIEVDVSQTNKHVRFRARIQFFSLCWTLFLAGWSDGSMGPLLPRIQSVYHVLSPPQT